MASCGLIRIFEGSQRGEARRQAVRCAEQLGFDAERTGRVAIVVTELASNLLKHVPSGGSLFVAGYKRLGAAVVEVVAVDSGPGLSDSRAFEDGYSTAGSAGIGLGAVRRMSDTFDLYTVPEKGTAIVSRIWRDGPADPAVTIGGVCGMIEGETVSGDDYDALDVEGRTRIILSDGLGHGPGARDASAAAIEVFRRSAGASLCESLEAMHRALRPTRGAAVALAEIDPAERSLSYVGLGNICGLIISDGAMKSLVSHNGTVGHTMSRIHELRYELPDDALLVLHSDGIKSRWRLDAYAGLVSRDPALVAAVLYRDFNRGRDDATAVAARVR